MPHVLPFLQQRISFPFPAPEVRFGIPLSSGTYGALIWGEGRQVRITARRVDDRLPLGRVDLELPDDWTLSGGGLHLLTGEAELELNGPRSTAKLRASILRDAPVLCLRITGVEGRSIRVLSRPGESAEGRPRGVPAAQVFDLGTFGGWMQEHPGEPALCSGWLRHENASGLLLFATRVFGSDPQEARREALQTLETANAAGYTPATLRAFSSQRKWWEQAVPQPVTPAELDALYHRALQTLAGLDGGEGSEPELLLPVAQLSCSWVRRPSNPQWAKLEPVFEPPQPVAVLSMERNAYWIARS